MSRGSLAHDHRWTAQPSQPISWHTQKFRYTLRTVLPQQASGANMTIMKNIKPELLPNTNNKIPGRWRGRLLQRPRNEHIYFEPERREDPNEVPQHHTSHVQPPSAYSAAIKLTRRSADWSEKNVLNTQKLKGLLREQTFTPGNFSTLYQPSKEKVKDMVRRLNYDPYERRELLALKDNESDEEDVKMLTKAEFEDLIKRLAKQKEYPTQPQPEKKPADRELTEREKAIVDRLFPGGDKKDKEEDSDGKEKKEKEDQDNDGDDDQEKTTTGDDKSRRVTKAELDLIIERLTKYDPEKCPADSRPVYKQPEPEDRRTVGAMEMDTILSRLMTFNPDKWPPESRPELYRLHNMAD